MKSGLLVLASVVGLFGTIQAQAAAPQLSEPWQFAYQGNDATGPHVLALWTFDSGPQIADASGHGHTAKLEDAKINPKGRFGACLESFTGWPISDKRHRALVKSDPRLSPEGAFTLEMWINPKPELATKYPDSFLLDKKYVSHTDYQLILGEADRFGGRALRAVLGFGKDSSTWRSSPLRLEPGKWHHIAFTYDGAGTGSFFVDGKPWGSQTIEGRKAVAPGNKPLSIGDRNGSLYHGFPGLIDEVRISAGALEFGRARFARLPGRNCFLRMEPGAVQRFQVTNLQRVPLSGGKAVIGCLGLPAQEIAVPTLLPGQSATIEYRFDTSLRPDGYKLRAGLRLPGAEALEGDEIFPVGIAARRPPLWMPVVMWGNAAQDLDRLKEIGFTHCLGLSCDYGKIWEAGRPTDAASPESVAEARQTLDNALANGVTLAISLSPAARMRGEVKFRRVARSGKTSATEDVCGLFPELRKFCYNVGASVARSYGDHPAFGAALIHTEVRDHARPCFHDQDFEAFRKVAGIDIPPEVTEGERGADYTKIAGFPANRVIPDDYPLYVYYRWYWKQGDGWNGLNTAVVEGLKTSGRKDFWTWNDPAVRVAKVFGSGGRVDVISHWTYSYPDPIRIGLAADELLAMARGAGFDQKVMKMTQIIWYRTQTAPPPKPGEAIAYRARWEEEQPDAPFITIAPMHLREAFWTKIARPIRGIMYHGWQSLVNVDRPAGYRYTNPETRQELARLVRQVVRPLGPTLLQVPAAKSDVAFLESFASEALARRGTYGWGRSWAGDAYHVLLYAKLQPEVVYDETVVQEGLDRFRVLVMADCDVITASMLARITEFQARGGIIVGDERLTPAVKADIVLPIYNRTARADADKAALQALAAGLRSQLDSRYARYVDTTSPEVIPYLRRSADADYVFLVNDRREYGEYVGQHGIVMENGLPSQTQVAVARRDGTVYDLVEGRPVPARREGGKTVLDLELGPCDGRIFLVTPRPIDRVRVEAPEAVDRGAKLRLVVDVLDAEGKLIEAVVPLEVSVRDPEGRPAEFSGYYGAAGGKAEIFLDIAPNDRRGMWRVEVRELASGHTAAANFRVRGPEPWPPARKPISKELANPVQPNG